MAQINFDKIPVRSILFGVSAFCFALLAYAWMLQYGPEKQQPCPLCILQRYVYIVVGVVALVGALHVRAGSIPSIRIGYVVASWVAAITGIALAAWHVLKGADMTSCRADPIGEFVNGLPMADWFPQYFFASGGCADKYTAFGLPLPELSLAAFVLIETALTLALVASLLAIRKRN
jgi:protein dithiol:quinone oxidoreductase